ncbi:hypothetical protein [Streptomyces sp. NRRL S-1022]|uniref:hypothetical protein n=1 Tax=Streptomyces sp. NRRL S-1022 TaxID=1463880 RepID=UPI003B634347
MAARPLEDHLVGRSIVFSTDALVRARGDILTSRKVCVIGFGEVVVDAEHDALMFSRQPVPYPRGGRPRYLRQLGLYGFTRTALSMFLRLPQGPLERTEGVEMLRFIEHGHGVRMLDVADGGLAGDTPDDLARAGTLLRTHAERTTPHFS